VLVNVGAIDSWREDGVLVLPSTAQGRGSERRAAEVRRRLK
jgi:hypothetical protein